MSDMRRSWLIQRLQKPHGATILGPDNPFSFGGGLRNGGLSDEAMSHLRSVFSFDYMGAAEFEWGAVPKALSRLAADHKKLVAFSFTIDLADVPGSWKDKTKGAGEAEVYVIARRDEAGEVRSRIEGFAREGHNDLKESTFLNTALRPVEDCGWLELDNGYFFFVDRTMWEKTATLFGAKVSERAT